MTENDRQHWALIIRYQAHLSQARASGDVSGEHMAHLGLGVSYFHIGQWQDAREHLTPALSWLVVREYWVQEMEHRGLLAYACLFDHQAGLALEHFTALRQLAHTHGVSSREAEGLLGCSRSLSAMDRDDEAAQACQQALALTRNPANADVRRQVLYELGFLLGHMGRNQEAVPLLEEALPLARQQGETDDEAHIHADLGVFLLGIPGRDQQGIDQLLAALALFRQLGNQREQSKTLADLATAHLRHRSARPRGIEEGLRYLGEAESLARAVDDRRLLASILETRGLLNERLGKNREALTAFQRASALAPHTRSVERLRSIGRVFQQLGQPESALEYDRKALLSALTLGDTGAEMDQLVHLSDDCLQRESFEQACAYLERAIGLALAGNDDVLTGRLHLRLAQILYARKDEKQPVRALALWRIGTLYAQGDGGAAKFRGDWHTLIHPVKELVEVLGRRAFLLLWRLSEPLHQQMLEAAAYAWSLARVGAVLGQEDPFAFLDVEPLTAFLFKINTVQLREWIREGTQTDSPAPGDEPWAEAFEQFFAGMAAEERFDWEAASDHFARASAMVPTFAEACIHRGALLAEEWLDTEALTYLDRAIDLAPDMWQAFYTRGHAYSLFSEPEQALADYEQALTLNPSAAVCRYERATAYLEVGEAKSAMLSCAPLITEYPFYQAAWLLSGRAWLAMGEYDQALGVFTDMIELREFEERGDIYYYRALAHLWLGNERKARADFTRSWRDFREVKAKVMLVWLAWGERKPTGKTISTWSEIAATNLTDWHADLLSLLLNLVRGQDESLLDEFDQLMDMEPTQFEAPFWRGMACAAMGKIDDAVQLWESALQLRMPPCLLAPLHWLEQDMPARWERVKALLDRSLEQGESVPK